MEMCAGGGEKGDMISYLLFYLLHISNRWSTRSQSATIYVKRAAAVDVYSKMSKQEDGGRLHAVGPSDCGEMPKEPHARVSFAQSKSSYSSQSSTTTHHV